MRQSRKDTETGEYRQIETSPMGFARYLVFRNASNEQIGVTIRICWRAMVFCSIAVFWGWTARAGWPPPYFPASDGQSIVGQVKDLRLRALEDSLIDARRVQCTATNKAYASQRLRDLQREYRILAGTPWDVPRCDEI